MARARVTVDAGICGHETVILAHEDEDGMIRLTIDTDCRNCQGLGEDLAIVDPMSLFVGSTKDGVVYTAAAKHPLHHACPVPSGIVKAIEVAANLALPRDVVIRVEKED